VSDTQLVPTNRWRATLIAGIVVFIGLLLLFRQTAAGMVHIWYNFETYTHGFLILPITLWLIWQKRAHLAAFSPTPLPSFLIVFAAALVLWGLARLVGVQVVEQFAFVALLVTALVSVLGWQVSKFLVFPLLFLFFAVPMGEDLTAPMMEFTATFTVEALKLSGIPVYRDGLWFSLPSGNWSVVEACSGVRYLIASVTLGVMYAYITYHTLWKRLLFIAFSAIVPIFANGLRAYMIVMIGHLSDMEYATGVDHLIYGWFFFGIVMFILFWVGSFWQEEEEPPRVVVPPQRYAAAAVPQRALLTVVLALVLAAVAAAGIGRAEHIELQMAGDLAVPEEVADWQRHGDGPLWSAAHQPTEHVIAARYHRGDDETQLFAVMFPQQRQGAEAINSDNSIAEGLVRSVGLGRQRVEMGAAGAVEVNRSRAFIEIDGRSREHLVWQWYRVAGRSLSNRYKGKAWEALSRIWPGRADGVWLAVSTPIDGFDLATAEQRLAAFAAAAVPEVNAGVDRALGIAD
jgi:exosortase A